MGVKRRALLGNMAGTRCGTLGSESSASAGSAVAAVTCGFLRPARLPWSGGHFPLEAAGECAVGGAAGRVLLQPATKAGEGWQAAPAPGRGEGVHRWEQAAPRSWHVLLWVGSQLASV